MILKDILAGTSSWLRAYRLTRFGGNQPDVNEEGLLTETGNEEADSEAYMSELSEDNNDEVIVKPLPPMDTHKPLGEMSNGAERLIEQLHEINGHLDRQVAQNEELIRDIKKLPELLTGFSTIVDSQKQVFEQLLGQLKSMSARDEQFMETVAQIPAQTAKQADALYNIDHQLAAAAEIDVQVSENFNKFNESLKNLNKNTVGHTESIAQMNKTFAASDRHLKYMILKQNKRFVWLFVLSAGVCVSVILILSGIIMYLAR